MKTLFFLFLAGISVGCASPWKSNYQPNPELGGQTVAKTDSAQVRTVEFERMQRYSAAERNRRVESTTAPVDQPPEEQLAAKNRLLEALQMRERGDEIELLGSSEFSTEQRLDPFDGSLEKFARSIGADYAVVSSYFSGRVPRIVDRPLTYYSHGWATNTGRRGHTVTASSSSTYWVPMTVIEDQYVYTVAYLRRTMR